MSEAAAITNRLLIAISKRYPASLAWRNNTGMGVGWSLVKAAIACIKKRDYAGAIKFLSRPVAWGLIGSADILVVMSPGARLIGLEVKVDDKQSPEQMAFEARLIALGGFYIVARSVEQAMADLEAACNHPLRVQ